MGSSSSVKLVLNNGMEVVEERDDFGLQNGTVATVSRSFWLFADRSLGSWSDFTFMDWVRLEKLSLRAAPNAERFTEVILFRPPTEDEGDVAVIMVETVDGANEGVSKTTFQFKT